MCLNVEITKTPKFLNCHGPFKILEIFNKTVVLLLRVLLPWVLLPECIISVDIIYEH